MFGRLVAHDEQRHRHGQEREQDRERQQGFLPAHGADGEGERGVISAMPAMEPVDKKNSAMPRWRVNQRLMTGSAPPGW